MYVQGPGGQSANQRLLEGENDVRGPIMEPQPIRGHQGCGSRNDVTVRKGWQRHWSHNETAANQGPLGMKRWRLVDGWWPIIDCWTRGIDWRPRCIDD